MTQKVSICLALILIAHFWPEPSSAINPQFMRQPPQIIPRNNRRLAEAVDGLDLGYGILYQDSNQRRQADYSYRHKPQGRMFTQRNLDESGEVCDPETMNVYQYNACCLFRHDNWPKAGCIDRRFYQAGQRKQLQSLDNSLGNQRVNQMKEVKIIGSSMD